MVHASPEGALIGAQVAVGVEVGVGDGVGGGEPDVSGCG